MWPNKINDVIMNKKLTYFSLYLIVLTILFNKSNAKIPEKQLCANPTCSVQISYAKTTIKYNPSEDYMIRVPPNVEVKVFSKHANLWGIEYNDQRGYYPSMYLKETRMMVKKEELVHEVSPRNTDNVTLDAKSKNLNDIKQSDTDEVLDVVERVNDNMKPEADKVLEVVERVNDNVKPEADKVLEVVERVNDNVKPETIDAVKVNERENNEEEENGLEIDIENVLEDGKEEIDEENEGGEEVLDMEPLDKLNSAENTISAKTEDSQTIENPSVPVAKNNEKLGAEETTLNLATETTTGNHIPQTVKEKITDPVPLEILDSKEILPDKVPIENIADKINNFTDSERIAETQTSENIYTTEIPVLVHAQPLHLPKTTAIPPVIEIQENLDPKENNIENMNEETQKKTPPPVMQIPFYRVKQNNNVKGNSGELTDSKEIMSENTSHEVLEVAHVDQQQPQQNKADTQNTGVSPPAHVSNVAPVNMNQMPELTENQKLENQKSQPVQSEPNQRPTLPIVPKKDEHNHATSEHGHAHNTHDPGHNSGNIEAKLHNEMVNVAPANMNQIPELIENQKLGKEKIQPVQFEPNQRPTVPIVQKKDEHNHATSEHGHEHNTHDPGHNSGNIEGKLHNEMVNVAPANMNQIPELIENQKLGKEKSQPTQFEPNQIPTVSTVPKKVDDHDHPTSEHRHEQNHGVHGHEHQNDPGHNIDYIEANLKNEMENGAPVNMNQMPELTENQKLGKEKSQPVQFESNQIPTLPTGPKTVDEHDHRPSEHGNHEHNTQEHQAHNHHAHDHHAHDHQAYDHHPHDHHAHDNQAHDYHDHGHGIGNIGPTLQNELEMKLEEQIHLGHNEHNILNADVKFQAESPNPKIDKDSVEHGSVDETKPTSALFPEMPFTNGNKVADKSSVEETNPVTSDLVLEQQQILSPPPEIVNSVVSEGKVSAIGSVEEIKPNESVPPVPVEKPVIQIIVEEDGLFAKIVRKVRSIFDSKLDDNNKDDVPLDEELERILYPDKYNDKTETISKPTEAVDGFCENLSSNSCPQSIQHQHTNGIKHPIVSHHHTAQSEKMNECISSHKLTYEDYLNRLVKGVLDMKYLILYLGITALTVLIFVFGHYCIDKCKKESPLINNLNVLERNLMVTKKENALIKGELDDTKSKLASIEDNSFGSNEMVIALKNQLEETEKNKLEYQIQVTILEKELENAAEAGLELNKMVSELLSNQTGSDSIISSVEELQKQLNEQQETIVAINTVLAEKSRENSELQILLSDEKQHFEEQLTELQSNIDELQEQNQELTKKITELNETVEVTVNDALKSKSNEILNLTNELNVIKKRFDEIQRKLHKSESRCHVLDEHLKGNKNNSKTDMKEILDMVQLKTEILSVKKEREQLKEKNESEVQARKLLEDHVKVIGEEVANLKKEYSLAEKEKVEAQTRLEVLSSYFKDKETQLQKELSIKEAMWMQQQGETTNTVERVRLMQDEIQILKSQNDSLRAEIEAQSAAHKLQLSTLDGRAHEAWLNAKQTERKLEESRVEAAGLRRKLTTFGDSNGNDLGLSRVPNGIDGLNDGKAPSPLHMGDNPGSPIMGGLPPPFMPPFMAPPPPPFIPPPFLPGEMRPPPLGRLMSPPPNRYSPNIIDDCDHRRYSPERRSGGRYSPDSRYGYNDVLSPYETETDFSPPPSPPPPRHSYRDNRGYKAYSPPPPTNSDRSKKSKGYSGSTDSLPRRGGGGSGNGKV